MKLVDRAGNAVAKKVVTKEVITMTGKTLLWVGGLYLAYNFIYGILTAIHENRTAPKEK